MNKKQSPVRRGQMPSTTSAQPKLFTDNWGVSYTDNPSEESRGKNAIMQPSDIGSHFGFLPNGTEPELTGRVVAFGDSGYNMARREFNRHFDKFPQVIVFAQDTKDVINAMRWAKYYQVPLRARSGRHSYEGLSAVDGGIVVDMSDMYQVDVDKRRGIVTVQTGIRSGALNELLWEDRLVVPMGLSPTTGIAGMTLGGGHSMLSRAYGLTADSLLGAEMVNADGRVLQANASQHPDLFWALCGGGGGNFGICTAFRFRAHAIDTVGFVEIAWDHADLDAVLQAWQRYNAPGVDSRLTMTLTLKSGLQSSTANSASAFAALDSNLQQTSASQSLGWSQLQAISQMPAAWQPKAASHPELMSQSGPEFTWLPSVAPKAAPTPKPEPAPQLGPEFTWLPDTSPQAAPMLKLEPISQPGSEFTWVPSTAPDAAQTSQSWLEFTSQQGIALQAVPVPGSNDDFPIFMQGVFLGSAAELRRLLEPLLRTGSPREATIEEIPWIDAAKRVARTQPTTPLPFKSVGLNVSHPLPAEALAVIRRFVESPPTSDVSVLFHGLGGAVARVPSHATAYYHRHARYTVTPFATWNQHSDSTRSIRFVERFRRAMRPYTDGVYVNTMDLEIRRWQEAYYGQNFPRLTRVKAKYDPSNFFNFPQSIPPAR